MAKIYETRKDIEREHLQQELDKTRNATGRDFDSAVIGALIATGSHTAEELHQLRSATANVKPSGFVSGLNKVLLWGGVITGAMALINWFRDGSKEATLSAHLAAAGPEDVKYPADSAETICESAEARKHCDRLQQEVAKDTQRSL
jgi:hypothetical protein